MFVLQHPKEFGHSIGTVGLASLGLAGLRVEVCRHGLQARPELIEAVRRAPGRGAALLFPGVGAVELGSLPPEERPSALVVLDGTWSQVKSLARENPWLAELPKIKLTPARPGEYRIRPEPADHCLSTLEALVAALRLLEPDNAGLDGLLGAFRAMIDRAITLRAERWTGGRRRARVRPAARPIPGRLTHASSVVVVYAETFGDRRTGDSALVYLVLRRLDDGVVFARFVRPVGASPEERHLAPMGLSADAVAAGLDRAALSAELRAFLRPGDVLAAWNQSVLDLLPGLGLAGAEAVLLKAAYANLTKRKLGHLADVVRAEGLVPAPIPGVVGRAGLRLAEAVLIAELLRARGRVSDARSPSPPAG